jgi:probable F420-dependent oxidoreductase
VEVKFSVQLPTDRVEDGDAFTSASAITQMASAIEAAGFDACWVTEHPFPSQEWMNSGGHHSLDPFVSLTAAAVATQTLRLHTNIIVLPYRNPFLTAKSIASLDVVSGGRVIMGVAAGYLEGEYRALGANFAERNAVTDEALVAMKQAWTGVLIKREGRDFQVDENVMLPIPVQRPHPPIWVGGNSRMAIRRAAEHGQGWSPFPIAGAHAGRTRTASIESMNDLENGIEYFRECANSLGRSENLDVNFVPFGSTMHSQKPWDPKAFVEQVQELEAIGVSWISLGVPGRSREEYLDSIAAFGAEVIR